MPNSPSPTKSPPSPHQLNFTVEGMSCASCVGRVERSLQALPGVTSASVNLVTGRADVAFEDISNAPLAEKAVADLGYKIRRETSRLILEGLHCASCVGKVEQALQGVPGVHTASVNLATERATIVHLPDRPSEAELIKAVENVGFRARPTSDGLGSPSGPSPSESQSLRPDVMVAAVLTLPVFLLEMGGHLVPAVHNWVMAVMGRQVSWNLQFVLTTLVLLGPGRRFFRVGLPALFRRAPDMNSLVALGSGAAYLYSVIATFASTLLPPGATNVYYEPAALIVTLILLGRYFEAKAKGRTGAAIELLVGLRAKTARRQMNGALEEVSIEEIQVGDLIQVRPGESVPVDGDVTEGKSFVDESMISGEPEPVKKSQGDSVIGGTLNSSGAFVFQATKVGADTVLSEIIRMVEEAQGAKLPIQAVVDKITMWFVPLVLSLAALTFAIWMAVGPEPTLTYALVASVAVLIIACPCAMGLATPTSIMVGTGRGAALGILFRRGEALQTLRDVQVVAFDKTGTLTEGRPQLTDFVVTNSFERSEVLTMVASVESLSEHPIALAIVAQAQEEGLETSLGVSDFQAHAGHGVSAQVGGRTVAVGADRFLISLGHEIGSFKTMADAMAEDGKSPLYAAIDGQLAAVLAVSDPVKDSSLEAIHSLRALGLKIAMVTGDNEKTAKGIARRLGIDDVIAEVMPDGKVDSVSKLRQKYGTLAFVGDGINDAPALAAADVGFAIGTGTDVAIEAADVVLMAGDLRAVSTAVELSRATLRNIQQNLFWAFAYNVLLIPVAAGALYPLTQTMLSPALAAGAMAFSSVFVVGNALRLKRFSPSKLPRSGDGDRV